MRRLVVLALLVLVGAPAAPRPAAPPLGAASPARSGTAVPGGPVPTVLDQRGHGLRLCLAARPWQCAAESGAGPAAIGAVLVEVPGATGEPDPAVAPARWVLLALVHRSVHLRLAGSARAPVPGRALTAVVAPVHAPLACVPYTRSGGRAGLLAVAASDAGAAGARGVLRHRCGHRVRLAHLRPAVEA